MCICDLMELEIIVWMTPPKPLPVPPSQMKPDSEKSPASSIRWGRCCGENCIPWRLPACLKCGRSPAGWLWRRFALASWLSVCVLCTCVHVWPCVVCLQQYTFTIVLLPLRQTTPESRVCLLISFFFFNIKLQGTVLRALFPPLSFVFLSFWIPLQISEKSLFLSSKQTGQKSTLK